MDSQPLARKIQSENVVGAAMQIRPGASMPKPSSAELHAALPVHAKEEVDPSNISTPRNRQLVAYRLVDKSLRQLNLKVKS
jgi:hypothetical protein